MKFFLATIVVLFFVTGCVSKSEKAKNTIPYKYRSPEQVLIACNNQMKRNTNNNVSAGSNIGNVLLGVMMGIQEDWACDPLR